MFREFGRKLFGQTLVASAAMPLLRPSSFLRCDTTDEYTPEERRTMEVFDKCSPSVVHITTQLDLATNWFEIARIDSGSGSGFIWDKSGHIVTNYHVIRNSTRANVTLSDQSVYEAELVGAEPDVDVAVLKVRFTSNVVPVEIGRSSKLRVGQRVFAIGNPFGLDQSLSSGVVSGVGRQIESVGGRLIKNVIQTDATINPGNSGGPLLDGRGQFIGINTMIASQTGGWSGVGFAVPSDTVTRTVNQIIKYGRAIRPWLGVSLAPMTVKAGKKRLEGVLVISVQVGSPADTAGIKGTTRDPRTGRITLGDEILRVDGQTVTDPEELSDHVETKEIGDKIILSIKRDGKIIDVPIVLKDRPSQSSLDVKRRSRL